MSVEKVIQAYQNHEFGDLLLGNKGYAIVYPHFTDLLSTDAYAVLLALNKAVRMGEISQAEIETNLQACLERFVNGTEQFYYCVSYVLHLLEHKTDFRFKIDIQKIRDLISSKSEIWLELETVQWNVYTLSNLCKRVVYGFSPVPGVRIEGINDFLMANGMEAIPEV